LIAYFLGNICAKNCHNRTAYVKIIASCKGGTFFETQCMVDMQPAAAEIRRGKKRKKDRKKLQGKNIMAPYYTGRP